MPSFAAMSPATATALASRPASISISVTSCVRSSGSVRISLRKFWAKMTPPAPTSTIFDMKASMNCIFASRCLYYTGECAGRQLDCWCSYGTLGADVRIRNEESEILVVHRPNPQQLPNVALPFYPRSVGHFKIRGGEREFVPAGEKPYCGRNGSGPSRRRLLSSAVRAA